MERPQVRANEKLQMHSKKKVFGGHNLASILVFGKNFSVKQQTQAKNPLIYATQLIFIGQRIKVQLMKR